MEHVSARISANVCLDITGKDAKADVGANKESVATVLMDWETVTVQKLDISERNVNSMSA